MRLLPLLFGAVVADQAPVASEKHDFQAEVSRLMDIIINSLYTHTEVFLRELISNSADALEKARHMSVVQKGYLGDQSELELRIEFDEDAKTLTLTDTGIGMTKKELIGNLGTVAKSGTANFLEAMASDSDKSLIGQFGVGFYSAFLVADKVTVTSKGNSDPLQHIWESSATSSFTIAEDPAGPTLGRGTRVVMHLKDEAKEFLSESKLKELATKFSQFIAFPIKLKVKREIEEKIEKEDDEMEVVDEESKPVTKKVTVFEWPVLNEQKPIWLRSKEDLSDADYSAFYKSIAKDFQDPISHTHFSAEGEVEFRSILFVPAKAPFDMMDNYYSKKADVKLYVRRVLVAEKFEDLLPKYLSFIKGVVDSDDLPLNVSREQLQQNKVMKSITKKLVKKILDMFKKLADGKKDENDEESEAVEENKEPNEKWEKFYAEFGKNLKMGCYEDDSNRNKIAKLLRFNSLKSPEKPISLDSYEATADTIYFMSGDDIAVMQKSPALGIFKKKGLDVLLLSDPLDEPCIQRLGTFEGKKLVSVQKADIKLEETAEEKKRHGLVKKHFKPLTDWWKKTLKSEIEKGSLMSTGVKIENVSISKRLVDAPCVVVSSQYGYSAQQERMMKAQAFQNKEQMAMMAGTKTLEINPNHPVIIDLLEKVKADVDDKRAIDTSLVLFQAALLDSGFDISDASALVQRVYKLMSVELGVDPEAPLKEVEIVEDKEETAERDELDSEEGEEPAINMDDFDGLDLEGKNEEL